MTRVVLLLLLAMLGHGLFMTSAGTAPACPVRAATAMVSGPVAHCADHDGGCFTVLNVAKSAARPLALPATMFVLPPSQPEAGAALWPTAAPGHPPDVTRALLQVYRN